MKKIGAPLILASILLFVLLSGAVFSDHNTTEETGDITPTWDNSIISYVTFNNTDILLDGGGATIEKNKMTIWSASTYVIKGSLDDGQIIVDTDEKGVVKLILNGTSITSLSSAPIFIRNADDVEIILASGTTNVLTDAETYIFEIQDEDEPKAAIFSNDDLNITGTGNLIINANYNNGIQSDDDLCIKKGTLQINSQNDALKGKDSLTIIDADIEIIAGNDGLQSDYEGDPDKGYIAIGSSIIDITSQDDGIQAETLVLIINSTISIDVDAGEGKGIKSTEDITIESGSIMVYSKDDAIHSDNKISINGGDITIYTDDDGIHAETSLEINGGDINIVECYEGLESKEISITGGSIHIDSSDDGINAVSSTKGGSSLTITGGYISIDSIGDGIDINGGVSMSAGTLLINGPTMDYNGPLDYDGSFLMTGGFLVAVGSSGMAQAPSITSTQYSVLVGFTSTLSVGTLVNIQDVEGNEIVTFAPTKKYQSIAVCSSEFELGTTYYIYTGGSSTGTVKDSLYSGGIYSPGTKAYTFTITSMVTTVGSVGGGGGGPPGRR